MASEAHLHAWEQRLRYWEAELEAREKQLKKREAILQGDGTTLRDASSSLEQTEAAGDGEQLETTLQEALSSLEKAEAAGGGETLGEARTILLEGTCARSAALALMTIANVANNRDNDGALLPIKAAERAVRDAFVVRCRSQAVPGNRASFLNVAWKAFGQPPDRDWQLRIPVLLGSYHKTAKGKTDTFPSKNKLATIRRGRPRPRKRQADEVNEVVPARIGTIIIRLRVIMITIMAIKMKK